LRLHILEIQRLFDESQARSYRRRKVRNKTRYEGGDKLGKFKVVGGPCNACDYPYPQLCVQYVNPEGVHFLKGLHDLGIDTKATILQDVDCALGINCGDYAKFHRQVAHIQDRMEARK
jgi:hypothetical protein